MTELRVVHVTDTHAPACNGVVRSIETSRVALRRLGVHVDVLAPGSRSRPAPQGVRLVQSLETSIYPGLHLAARPVTRRMLRGYDVVHVHTPGPLGLSALWAARRLGMPTVYTYHTRFDDLVRLGVRRPSFQRWLLKGLDRVERAIDARSGVIIAPTQAIARELETRLRAPIATVPSGVDVDRFRPMARVTTQPPTFLTLGRISREKDLEAILRAFGLVLRALPDARLRIGGSGPDEERCRRLAHALKLEGRVEWLGFVHEDALAATYAEADVFVTASRFETQGLTVLEAQASGAAVALAACDVFEPIVRAGAAISFETNDPDDVARGMVSAYEARARLASEGLRVARRASTHACARRLFALYADLARIGRAPRAAA